MIDRGIIKWHPFDSCYSSAKILNEIHIKKEKETLPILSEDQLNVLEEKIKQDPSYEEVLIQQIKARFENSIDPRTDKPKRFDPDTVRCKYYFLKGSLRKKQIAAGKPIKFNKTIVLYISVFVLAHYRCNVCIQNYLLCD